MEWEDEIEDGVLDVYGDYDAANFNTTYFGLTWLRAHGVKTIIYRTHNAYSEFDVNDALAKYFIRRLIIWHDDASIILTLADVENTTLLKQT